MHVLVTGGAGYIGAVTAEVLLARGHRVTVLDDLSNGHLDAVPDGADLWVTDIGVGKAVADVLARTDVDACLHFAAVAEAGRSMQVPEEFFRTNTAATAVLLEELLRAGVDRFVLSSTCAVYGDPVRLPLDEDHPTAPTNPYGESKLLIERMLRWHRELRGLRTACLRYFNAAGASAERGERHHDETHLIPLVLDAAAGRRPEVRVLGTDYPTPDGTAVRDYVHVLDLADAHVLALEALSDHTDLTVNLGTGRGHSVREVIASVERVTGLSVPTVEAPRRPGDPSELVAAADRAAALLGWRPARPDLDTIVADAWAFHQRTPNP
jgi:UDP-glucose 4-epimerase